MLVEGSIGDVAGVDCWCCYRYLGVVLQARSQFFKVDLTGCLGPSWVFCHVRWFVLRRRNQNRWKGQFSKAFRPYLSRLNAL